MGDPSTLKLPTSTYNSLFEEESILKKIKHFLPTQPPLKDFIHHNTLHAFQYLKFYDALRVSSEIFGYKTSLSPEEYKNLYRQNKIKDNVLEKIIGERKGQSALKEYKNILLNQSIIKNSAPRIGSLRKQWKDVYEIDMDSHIHPLLFRIICSYLDQGISIWNFPVWENGFLASVQEVEQRSFSSFFKTKKIRKYLLQENCSIDTLLSMIVGDESLYEQYLFDQQFSHPGWSGMSAYIEDNSHSIFDLRKISLHDIIVLELLLELDLLYFLMGESWKPLCKIIKERPETLFTNAEPNPEQELLSIWQDAYEWSYYDEVLSAIQQSEIDPPKPPYRSFQAMFCIDDREASLRRYLEKNDEDCETFAVPGFFNVEFYFQPEGSKHYTKQCPAPITPKHIIKETNSSFKRSTDINFTKNSYKLFYGWIVSQTLGFWSGLKLFLNIFRPSLSSDIASSLRHMGGNSQLSVICQDPKQKNNDLQIGFTIEEMADRIEPLLKSIGLGKHFAPLIYVVGHGATSANNPHYAGYDCGACCGRPGSVNARVFSIMANNPEVRFLLTKRGINIPDSTTFVGALHDTTRDEVCFYDENTIPDQASLLHQANKECFRKALDENAKERSRRFASINTNKPADLIHNEILERSVSLFEPRPELNHATNALCIIGGRDLTKKVFLDRRAFMNSYDYEIDANGDFLFSIIKAAAPVCGGINLEYYFSRVDNEKLGAGTKLPHNVMGLIGVANGIDGDLRTGLPSQMIEVHDPIRLMIIIEHFPETVLNVIKRSPETYEWFINEWVHLIVVHPKDRSLYYFKEGMFKKYSVITRSIPSIKNILHLIENHTDNIPVHTIA